jgi:peptidoglycan/LPS O-acetylase OafA/YrhL
MDVTAVLGIALAIFFARQWIGFRNTRYETVDFFLSSAIFATLGMLSSNRWVWSFAVLLVIVLVIIGCHVLLFDGHREVEGLVERLAD